MMVNKEKEQLKMETALPIPYGAMSFSQSNVGMGIGAEMDGAGLREYLACQMIAKDGEEGHEDK